MSDYYLRPRRVRPPSRLRERLALAVNVVLSALGLVVFVVFAFVTLAFALWLVAVVVGAL